MKIALIGASGNVGSRLLAELISRGHQVTAISRHPEKIHSAEGVTPKQGDANDPASLAPLLAGHDAVVVAVRFSNNDMRKILQAVKGAGVPRLLVVGGSSNLEVAPGLLLIDAPDFNPAYVLESRAGIKAYEELIAEKSLDWTYLSPPKEIGGGKRTGKFRLGHNQLLVDANGRSFITVEDFAVAMVDELEKPSHSRQRFTVAY